MISQKNALCLEFDFAQNLPVPKIPVKDQFFKRLMWIYVFNVHVHSKVLDKNIKQSYMFLMPEGLNKRGANTVCNFVSEVIKKGFN